MLRHRQPTRQWQYRRWRRDGIAPYCAVSQLHGVEQELQQHQQQTAPRPWSSRILTSIDQVDASDWDELCQGGHEWQPFLAHRFLRNLERSGSASVRRGWIPHHVLLYDGLDAAEQPAAPTYASDLPWNSGWLAGGAGGLPSSPTVPDTDRKQRFANSFSLEEGEAGGGAGAGAGAEGRGGAVSEAGLAGSVWQYVRELGTWAQGVADMSSGWGAGRGGDAAGGAVQGATQPPSVKPGRSQGRLVAAMPAYLKLHSNGEYVYDQSWASLADSLDVEYYPKLQVCVPFVPVTGPRMLLRPGCSPDEAAALRKGLVQAALQAAVAVGASSVHVTFCTEQEAVALEAAGGLTRLGLQYHLQCGAQGGQAAAEGGGTATAAAVTAAAGGATAAAAAAAGEATAASGKATAAAAAAAAATAAGSLPNTTAPAAVAAGGVAGAQGSAGGGGEAGVQGAAAGGPSQQPPGSQAEPLTRKGVAPGGTLTGAGPGPLPGSAGARGRPGGALGSGLLLLAWLSGMSVAVWAMTGLLDPGGDAGGPESSTWQWFASTGPGPLSALVGAVGLLLLTTGVARVGSIREGADAKGLQAPAAPPPPPPAAAARHSPPDGSQGFREDGSAGGPPSQLQHKMGRVSGVPDGMVGSVGVAAAPGAAATTGQAAVSSSAAGAGVRPYTSFEEFLMALKQSKRKNVRQVRRGHSEEVQLPAAGRAVGRSRDKERKAVARLPLRIRRLSGEQLRAEGDALWHNFYSFYQDTADRYWGNAYLTQDFFTQLGRDMADAVVLVVAEEQVAATQQPGKGEAAAGSAMKIGAALVEVESERSLGAEAQQQAASTWQQLQGGAEGGTGSAARGAPEPGWPEPSPAWLTRPVRAPLGRAARQGAMQFKGLHMECCYYQAVEEALGRGLIRVEAGMQGEHKLQRGYLPAVTYSSHFLFNPHLKHVVAQSLVRERAKVLLTLDGLTRECSAYPPTTTTQALQRILAHLQQHAPQSVQQTLAALASVRALRLGFEPERKASGQDASSRLGPMTLLSEEQQGVLWVWVLSKRVLHAKRTKRTKRTKAEPEAAEPTKGKGKAAKAKPAPQPGRWLDRDCNAALNMQRIGEQGKLPAKGKEYPGLGYKRLRDKPPKAQQQQAPPI
ncbi:hypothetical protein QJQ45_027085 [Haematococcus lacustris]|nr:hypothetical protein QJQ45_027085 [Haematococcus lacustris]